MTNNETEWTTKFAWLPVRRPTAKGMKWVWLNNYVIKKEKSDAEEKAVRSDEPKPV